MKHRLYCIVVFASCLFACGPRDNDAVLALKQGLIQSNENLPMKYAFISLDKMEIVKNDYIVRATIDEELMNLDEYVSNMGQNKFDVFSIVSNNNRDFAELFKESGLNFVFDVTGLQSERHQQIVLSADEIKKALETEYTSRDFVEAIVNSSRQGLPEAAGNGITFTDICIEDGFVCYKYLNDESVNSLSGYRRAKNELEEVVLEGIVTSDDPEEILYYKYMVDCGLGMKFIYSSKKTGESLTVTFTDSMLKEALAKRSE